MGSQSTTACVTDTTAPTPNPMTWSSQPSASSSSQISMTASSATDSQSPPVSYFFDFVSSSTGGSGGTDSSWQSSTSYADSGLQANHSYSYRVMARDSASSPNATAYSSTVSRYTLSNLPGAAVFSNIAATSIRANWTTNGNRSGTEYYCENTTRGTNSGWTTSTSWTSTGLSCGTAYSFRVKSRNGDGLETGWTSLGSQSTTACVTDTTAPTPNPMTWSSQPSASSSSQISMTASSATDSQSPPVSYFFDFVSSSTGGSGGTDSSWQSSTSYADSGLQANHSYSYRVIARDSASSPNATAYSSTVSRYTLSNLPGAAVFSNIAATSIRANWTTNGNRSGTEYYCENTTRGTNSGWTTSTSWTSTGLSCGTAYSFRVKSRNGDGLETGWTSLGSQSTIDCSNDVYVNSSLGSDLFGNGSEANPWKTITYAVSQVDGAIDNLIRIHISEGLYDVSNGESFPITAKPYINLVGAGKDKTMINLTGTISFIYADSVQNFSLSNLHILNGYSNTWSQYGGAVELYNDSSATIIDCFFENNTAERGGAIAVWAGSEAIIEKCIFLNNNSIWIGTGTPQGGAIHVSSSSTAIINNTEFNYNHSDDRGGAINLYSSSEIAIDGCSFLQNDANNGGAIYCLKDCYMGISNSIFYKNSSSSFSGAIFQSLSNSNIVNSVFSGNSAISEGGALKIYTNSLAEIINCTFSNNQAGIGGAIYNDSTLSSTIVNSILWGDSPNEINDIYNAISVSYSDIDQTEYSSIDNNFNTNPEFFDAVNCNLKLKPSSPCIDAGTSSNAPSDDLEGRYRPQGKGFDIGAYEYSMKSMPWIPLLLLAE